jgi:hypothetical protein
MIWREDWWAHTIRSTLLIPTYWGIERQVREMMAGTRALLSGGVDQGGLLALLASSSSLSANTRSLAQLAHGAFSQAVVHAATDAAMAGTTGLSVYWPSPRAAYRHAYDELSTAASQVRARWVTLRARWVTLRARWVTLRARWVTLRARWVTLRARWVTLRDCWVTLTLAG